jgi:HK97 family phage prohead protease
MDDSMDTPSLQYKDFTLTEFKSSDAGMGPGEFKGYAATFGNVDRANDVIQPGAFDRTFTEMKAQGTYPAMLWSHKIDEPIGEWLDMTIDRKGLHAHGKLWIGENIPNADRAYKMLKTKNGKGGLSIGYKTVKSTRDSKTSVRNLLDLDLHETSIVSVGCNPLALVESVKALENEFGSIREAEKYLRDRGLSNSESKAFISRMTILLAEPRDESSTVDEAALQKLAASLRSLNDSLKKG